VKTAQLPVDMVPVDNPDGVAERRALLRTLGGKL
jgi:hypothetical protein